LSTSTFHEDIQCGACGGPLETDRNAICHGCTRSDPNRPALLALLEEPCPLGTCSHAYGDHGLDSVPGGELRVVCCNACPCGWSGKANARPRKGMRPWHVWETEYAEDGAGLFWAWSEKGALRQWRRSTRTRGSVDGMPPLSAEECTEDCPCRAVGEAA
jgi:hypothetical protein